jgi:hypothetical protein
MPDEPHFEFSAFRKFCEEKDVKVKEVEWMFAEWIFENGGENA